MHPNPAFDWKDRDEMLAFVAEVSFSTIFFSNENGPRVAHVPVTVEAPDRLRFHLARSNRAAPGLDGSQVLLSCLGPDAYISPDWYGTPDQVPTWNYLAVECEGTARQLGEDDLVAQLDRLSAAHESRLAPKAPWTRDKMTPGRFEAMLRAITCYEIHVRELRGTRKLGQNKKPAERDGASRGLAAAGSTDMAELMRGEFAGEVNRLAIFDCDGTLVDSQANICLAMEQCFERFSLAPPPRERTRRVVGLSLVEAMQAMLPEGNPELHVSMAGHYKHAFHALRGRGLVEEPLYDGVAELIETLDADGWLLGVATGKSDRGLRLCLEHHGLHPRFVTLQTADRHPSKPHPSMIEQAIADAGAAPHTSIMIGDTSFDMAMARAAGVTAIGVAWGYHEAEELKAAGADFIAEHPRDISAFLKALA